MVGKKILKEKLTCKSQTSFSFNNNKRFKNTKVSNKYACG